MSTIWNITKWLLDSGHSHLRQRMNPALKPARRLRQLAVAHGLSTPQLLRIVPADWNWTLATLESDQKLIAALTAQRISWWARRFGVRQQWLEADSSEIYEPVWAYKNWPGLFRRLQEEEVLTNQPELYAVTNKGACEFRDLIFVFSSILLDEPDLTVRRYTVCGDEWSWDHPPSRWRAKALGRWFWLTHRRTVPIIKLSTKELRRLCEGIVGPRRLIAAHRAANLAFEDYGLSTAESKHAKETNELPEVLAHYKDLITAAAEVHSCRGAA